LAKRERTLLHSRHKIKLDSVRGVLSEQCRIYRAWTNDKLSASGLTSAMSALKEVRATLEALAPVEANASRPISSVTIVSVPANHFFRHPRADIDGMALENGALMIEHDEKPSLALAPEPPQPEPEERYAEEPAPPPEPQPAPKPDNPNIVMSASLKHKRELAALEAERRAGAFNLTPPRRTQRPHGPSWG